MPRPRRQAHNAGAAPALRWHAGPLVLAAACTTRPSPATPPPCHRRRLGAAGVTANVLPPWLAPNLITLMGVLALLGAYAVGAVHLPEFEGQAPRWLYFLKWVLAGAG